MKSIQQKELKRNAHLIFSCKHFMYKHNTIHWKFDLAKSNELMF